MHILLYYLLMLNMATPEVHNDDFLKTTQMVVVTAANDTTIHAEMNLWSKVNGKWTKEGAAIPVVLGRSGLIWGHGLHRVPADVQTTKSEGDGKSPAGIFPLRTAFGEAEQPAWLKMPYLPTSDIVYCVDDKTSGYYNRIISSDTVTKDWNSAEDMRRKKDKQYVWGVVIDHNPHNTAGLGSCIFMHVWKNANHPTAGCTAMAMPNMVKLLHWLDASKHPLLVQGTEEQVKMLREGW